jgi:Holliday junction DNA helicase RuvA
MIRRVVGRLLHKGPDGVEVMTSGGVSYELWVPATLLDRLPEVGQEVELHCALVAREDSLQLFGFGSARDRTLFLRLQNASGVGPRLALALLGQLPGDRVIQAIRGSDHQVLQSVSGVGRKTAERIALELKDRLDDLAVEEAEPLTAGASAVDALRALGYGQSEAEAAVARARRELEGRGTTEELVRAALGHV